MRHTSLVGAIGMALVLASGPTFGSGTSFQQLDIDGDQVLSPAEFEELSGQAFQHFDDNDDSAIDMEELRRAVLQVWDTNADGRLSEAEFISPGDWGSGLEALDFGRLDENSDESLTPEEFLAFQEEDMFAAWDPDDSGSLTEQEFSSTLYSMLDQAKSDGVDETEFEVVPRILSAMARS